MKKSSGETSQVLDHNQAQAYFADFWRTHPYTTIWYKDRDWCYLRGEKDTGKSIIFLHGGGFDAGMWAYQLNELGKEHRVIAPSFDLVPDLFRLRSEVIREIMDREGIREAVFCGHSYGGILAQFFASYFPERVSGLVLTNTFLPTQGFVRHVRRKKLNVIKYLPACVIRAALRKRLADVPGSAWNAYRREYLQGLYSRADHKQLVLFYNTFVETLAREIPDFVLWQGKTLLINSRDDTDTFNRFPELTGAYPGARVRLFETGGHHTPMLFPEEFTRLVGEFIE
ncbi:MAG: alpha/beta hydrolase [Firmicutes bacterium]|nr:alpha/beta hydrolase [Bacillota bacterium]